MATPSPEQVEAGSLDAYVAFHWDTGDPENSLEASLLAQLEDALEWPDEQEEEDFDAQVEKEAARLALLPEVRSLHREQVALYAAELGYHGHEASAVCNCDLDGHPVVDVLRTLRTRSRDAVLDFLDPSLRPYLTAED